jgi:sorbose reductase
MAIKLTRAKYNLRGKAAVITGAARGLGLAFAEALAAAGCNIAVLDILSEASSALHDLQAKHSIVTRYYRVDITSQENVNTTISQIVRDFGRIDININAAGVVTDESFLTTSLQNLQKTFVVNINGSFLVAQACANAMVDRYKSEYGDTPATHATTGSIVFIASIATYMASSAQQISCYTASKAAIKGLVKPVAMELSRYGIRVNSLSPGYTMTDMMRGLQREQPDLVKQFEKETLFGRIGLPQELQGAILWLCSDRASGWYTGQDLLVDGGATSWKHPAVLN